MEIATRKSERIGIKNPSMQTSTRQTDIATGQTTPSVSPFIRGECVIIYCQLGLTEMSAYSTHVTVSGSQANLIIEDTTG